ncbi:hypothetical protein AB4072_07335 [Microvirga sp. 2MCAF38]|uniref:hypothetical protein n=1 Tax=Microvirga sp. 2MCAF38 TaxID=3232989 RepID=UPI003F995966
MTQSDSIVPIRLAELCRDAVERFGDDWESIQAYIIEQVASMPGDDLIAFNEQIRRVLGFLAPIRGEFLN